MAALKSILTVAASIAAVLLILALIVRLLENRMTFHPTREFEYTPGDIGLKYEDFRLEPAPGEKIHGWYFPPRAGEGTVLLICHGNAGNISHRLGWIEPFLRRGFGALLFDYRGYGRSEGTPGQQALEEDVAAAWEHLRTERGLAGERIALFGRSLGSYPASWLAARCEARCLVLEGAFTTGAAMARRVFGLLPAHLVMKNEWDVAGNLELADAPVLLVHGTADQVVPFELGKRLAGKHAPEGTELFTVEGGGHLYLQEVIGEKYYDRIAEFIRTAENR